MSRFIAPLQPTSASQLEVRRTLVLSTRHIRASTNTRLLEACIGECGLPYIGQHHYGFYLWVPHDEESLAESCGQDTGDVADLLRFAFRHGFHEIKLDRDGPALPDLPTYDWDTDRCFVLRDLEGEKVITPDDADAPAVRLRSTLLPAAASQLLEALHGCPRNLRGDLIAVQDMDQFVAGLVSAAHPDDASLVRELLSERLAPTEEPSLAAMADAPEAAPGPRP